MPFLPTFISNVSLYPLSALLIFLVSRKGRTTRFFLRLL